MDAVQAARAAASSLSLDVTVEPGDLLRVDIERCGYTLARILDQGRGHADVRSRKGQPRPLQSYPVKVKRTALAAEAPR